MITENTEMKKTRKRSNEENISQQVFVGTFIEVMQECKNSDKLFTPEAVARKLHLEPASVSTRASNLRNAGVKLPKFDRKPGGRKTDAEALNKMIAAMEADGPSN